MYHYVIPLLEKKPENIILHLGKKDAPYKSDTAILKDLIELKDFILEKSHNCKKITLQFVLIENTLRKTMKILQID